MIIQHVLSSSVMVEISIVRSFNYKQSISTHQCPLYITTR